MKPAISVERPSARLPIGQRLRDRRLEVGIAQTALAIAVGISASYLNLIEHDKRAIGGALLKRIAAALGVDVDHLTGTDDMVLVQDVLEVARGLGFGALDQQSVERFVAREPEWATAFRSVHRRYQGASDTAMALSDRLSQDPKLVELTHAVLNRITAIKSIASILHADGDIDDIQRQRFSEIISIESDLLGSSARDMIELLSAGSDTPGPATPRTEVDDFIIYSGNHFPTLEDAANRLRQQFMPEDQDVDRCLLDWLTLRWQVDVDIQATKPVPAVPLSDETENNPKRLVLDRQSTAATRRFRMARKLIELELQDLIDTHIVDARLTSDGAQTMARRALANYGAGALLMLYDQFLEAAETHRYDIDQLGYQFGMSFEQIAHRLVTLRRPGAAGVPFAFLRADPAGNLSKPFSTIGLRMPRLGSACPLWVLYAAFSQPDTTLAQMATMPQGETYLFVARRLAKRVTAYGTPQTVYSVMIGCDAVFADRVVYGDGYQGSRKTLATPAGYTCASCPRKDCGQRAAPFILG